MLLSARRQVTIKIVIICILMLHPVSCALMGSKEKDEEAFVAAVERFNSDLRWEDYKQASLRVVPTLQEDFWRIADGLHGRLRLMDYEIRDIKLDDSGLSGSVLLSFRYYRTNDPQIKSQMLHERWAYDENEEFWQLVQHDLDSLISERR